MRRVTFTKAVSVAAAFGYEQAVDKAVEPRMHSIAFKKGEVVDLYEWGWGEEWTNFASNDPSVLSRVKPGDSTYDAVVILNVPYDCHESEPALPMKEEPFRVKTPEPSKDRPPIPSFLLDSGSLDDEDLIDSHPTATGTA